MIDLHYIPKFLDKIPFSYLEHTKICVKDNCVVSQNEEYGVISLPVAQLAVLMLGPGTDITHAAIQEITAQNCLLIWCGEGIVRCYAHSQGGTHSSHNIIYQAFLLNDNLLSIEIIQRLMCKRFPKENYSGLSIKQIMGIEGNKMRDIYSHQAQLFGIKWEMKDQNITTWENQDIPNKCLSVANSCLYGVCHAAILSLGYSPALGFIHKGDQRSFVFDIADMYKPSVSIPVAFSVAKDNPKNPEKSTMIKCKEYFYQNKFLSLILKDLEELFDFPEKNSFKNT